MTNMSLKPYLDLQSKIKKLDEEIVTLETKLLEKRKLFANSELKSDKDKFKKQVAQAKVEYDIAVQGRDIAKTQLQEIEIENSQEEKKEEKEIQKELDELSIISALQDMNANFIINDNKWHCIYGNGVRHQPMVKEIEHEIMINHVFRVSDNFVDNKTKLLRICKNAGRMYRDVERTFHANKNSTLNQMNELRTFWLKPVFDKKHHVAFDILTDNIVGGDQSYKDQIEKYIAYSYVKPDDIFAPNIDSSAKGGAGRDTLFRILEIIFTEECCGEAKKETVQGTHNGELNGKIWVKVSEQNNKLMNIEELKNLTGGHNFRLREMGKNAVQVPRTFRFFMMSNNYEGTAKLTGGGGGAEDRRWEPILSTTDLFNQLLKLEPDPVKCKEMLQDWQSNVWQNETEIAMWLGNIIEQSGYKDYYQGLTTKIHKLAPLHGIYYQQMLARQKRAFDRFMEAIQSLTSNSTVYNIDKMWQIYKVVSYNSKYPNDKTELGKKMAHWLTLKTGDEWEMAISAYYKDPNNKGSRSKSTVVKPTHITQKQVFDIWDFLEDGAVDEKGKDLNDKPHSANVKEEF